jgi:hypothetical protein
MNHSLHPTVCTTLNLDSGATPRPIEVGRPEVSSRMKYVYIPVADGESTQRRERERERGRGALLRSCSSLSDDHSKPPHYSLPARFVMHGLLLDEWPRRAHVALPSRECAPPVTHPQCSRVQIAMHLLLQ